MSKMISDSEHNNMSKPIGRIIATEKNPTTMDQFIFWTDPDRILHAFDVVKVEHINGSFTFGVIENISHITDAANFLTNYISSDFGNAEMEEPTLRVGMNYAAASVSYNTKDLYTPVHNNARVYLATADEIAMALGLDRVENPVVCGFLKMYEHTDDEVTLPVKLNSKYLLGPEGAHLNISGISGLAAKTSYAMFLMKAVQQHDIEAENKKKTDEAGNQKTDVESAQDDSVAFVIFNVKGRDLMSIHVPNDFSDYPDPKKVKEQTDQEYRNLDLSTEPFQNVHYFIPCSGEGSPKRNTYLSSESIKEYIDEGILSQYKYTYADDKESLEMLFSDVEDPQQTMDSIISKIIDNNDPDFGSISTWSDFLEKIDELSKGSGAHGKDDSGRTSNEISVLSWRKFKRIINKAVKNDALFSDDAGGVHSNQTDCRLNEKIKHIKNNDVFVIDVAKLSEDKQAFVFGDTLRTVYNLKLDEYDGEEGVNPPAKIIVFIDELNKYASKDAPKSSPILKEILDITERGRSLGVILFGAEQFRSNIHPRITGNCSTHAYGRTNSLETSQQDYISMPETYKSMLTRLQQGEYLIQNPLFRSLIKIRFPKPIYNQFNQSGDL